MSISTMLTPGRTPEASAILRDDKSYGIIFSAGLFEKQVGSYTDLADNNLATG